MKFRCKTIRSCCFLSLFVRFLFAGGGGGKEGGNVSLWQSLGRERVRERGIDG